MQLTPWSYPSKEGITLRGWHSPASGKPLLHVLHGNGFCGRTYEPMLRPLSEHFDLWLCDVQGHGDSDPGTRFLGWNRQADMAMDAFQAQAEPVFGTVPCFALGHSYGGVLTALATSAQPHRFRASVLLDPVFLPPPMALALSMAELAGLAQHTPLARSAAKRRAHWPDRTAATDALRGRGTYKGWHEDALSAFITHALTDAPDGGVRLKCDPALEARVFSSSATGLWSALRRVKTPTLILHGQDTFDFVPTAARQWADQFAGLSVQEVPGGHCFMQEHPQEAARRVHRFLQDHF